MRLFIQCALVCSLVLSCAFLTPKTLQGAERDKDKDKQSAKGQQALSPEQAAAMKQAQEEGQALQALRDELDPDRQIQLATEFEQKYPNSSNLTYAYVFAANGYGQKNDLARAVEFGEKSLKLDPDNLMGLLMTASWLAQPQLLRSGDLDKEKKLMTAETYASRALKLIEQLAKQPNETEEDFQKRKKILSGEPHSALGMIHLQRSSMGLAGPDPGEVAKAVEEYKLAVTLVDRPHPEDYFRLGEAEALQNKVDEAIAAFTKAAEIEPRLKPYTDPKIEDLKKRQSQAKPAAKS